MKRTDYTNEEFSSIGLFIKAVLDLTDVQPKQLATKLDISSAYLSSTVNGHKQPTIKVHRKFRDYLRENNLIGPEDDLLKTIDTNAETFFSKKEQSFKEACHVYVESLKCLEQIKFLKGTFIR